MTFQDASRFGMMGVVTEEALRLLGWIGRRPWSDQHGYDPGPDEIWATVADRRPKWLVQNRLHRLAKRLSVGGYQPVREFAGRRRDLCAQGDIPGYAEDKANDRLKGVVCRRVTGQL